MTELTVTGQVTLSPTELWIIWDETDGPRRETRHARVLGWVSGEGASPYPFVIHPETGLPATLGLDGPASVSKMWITDAFDKAKIVTDGRRAHHGGRSEPVGTYCDCPHEHEIRVGKGAACEVDDHTDPLTDPRWGPTRAARALAIQTAVRMTRGMGR